MARKGRRLLQVWIDDDLDCLVRDLAKRAGRTECDLVRVLLRHVDPEQVSSGMPTIRWPTQESMPADYDLLRGIISERLAQGVGLELDHKGGA